MLLSKFIYLLGCKRRNPTLLKQYDDLKKSETWSREQLLELQMIKLKKLLQSAYSNTQYYREMFDNLNIDVNDIKSIEDLKLLPILEKADIIKNSSQMRNHQCKNVFYSETSGSTGEPLVFYRGEEWDSAGRAAQLRGYSWYGIKPWDKNGYLWGHLYGSKFQLKTRLLDFLVNRFRLFSYDKQSVSKFAKRLNKATYLEGYSSMIYEVAKQINSENIKKRHVKRGKGTSEKIFDSYQCEVEKAFGVKMVSEYGAGESTLIAYECPHGNMHVVMENVIVEEENGEIIVTNLNSFSMPIIRYRLGDSIILDRVKKCPCGMQHEIIADVVGRIGKTIYGKDGKYPSLTLYYIFKAMAFKTGNTINYQGIQTEKGKLKLLLDREINSKEREVLLKECENYFGYDMDIVIAENQLNRDHTKKFQDFISEIKI